MEFFNGVISAIAHPIYLLGAMIPLGVGVIAYSSFVLERGSKKFSFIAFVISTQVYAIAIALIKADLNISFLPPDILSKFIFAFIELAIVATLVFSVFFVELNSELKKIRFWAILLGLSAWVGLLNTDYVAGGVRRVSYGWAPIHGPLFKYVIIFNLFCGSYFVWIMVHSYRQSYSEPLRFQIRYLAKYIGIAFLVIGFFNGLLPLLGDSRFSLYGPLSFFGIYYGLLNLLVNQRSLLIENIFRKLSRAFVKTSEKNFRGVRMLIFELAEVLETNPPEKDVQFEFATAAGPAIVFFRKGKKRKLPGRIRIFPEDIESALVAASRFQNENMSLRLILDGIRGRISEAVDAGTLSPNTGTLLLEGNGFRGKGSEIAAPASPELLECLRALDSSLPDGRSSVFDFELLSDVLHDKEIEVLQKQGYLKRILFPQLKKWLKYQFTQRAIILLENLPDDSCEIFKEFAPSSPSQERPDSELEIPGINGRVIVERILEGDSEIIHLAEPEGEYKIARVALYGGDLTIMDESGQEVFSGQVGDHRDLVLEDGRIEIEAMCKKPRGIYWKYRITFYFLER